MFINKIRRGRAGVFVVLLLTSARFLSSAQAAENSTQVSLGVVSGPPKDTVMVPFYLAPDPPGRQIGSVSATVRFQNNGVAFVRGEKGFLLDGVNADFTVELQKDPQDADRSLLQVVVATRGEPRKALREGLLMTLVFRIEENAAPGTNVVLEMEKVRADDLNNPPQSVEPLSGKNGMIEIISPESVPYVACFFFTH